jgi:hypothetical protein
MSFGGATFPCRCLAQTLACVAFATALPHLATLRAAQSPISLRAISVDEINGTFVVTLNADGPIASRLQRLPGSPERLFLDLPGVQPKVVAHTPVDQGPILRVRVGLNAVDPLVTRVVIDLTARPPARLEAGANGHELRVVIGREAEPALSARPPRPGPASVAADASWCRDFAARLEALLQAPAAVTPATAMATDAAWAALEEEAGARKPAQPFESIHTMLEQAVRLARIATGGRHRLDEAAAARSGARLLIDAARARLADLP